MRYWLGQPGEGFRVSLPSVGDESGLVGSPGAEEDISVCKFAIDCL